MSEYTEETKNEPRSTSGSPVQFSSRSEVSSGYFSSTPNTPTTPQSISPPHTLKRSRSSSFRLINRRISTVSASSQLSIPQEPEDRLAALIGWYPAFLIRILWELFCIFSVVAIKRLPFVLPTLWISACLWVFWKSVLLPLSIIKGVLTFIFVPASERRREKRTIVISGGSTVQTIHLARSFHSAGNRVVVIEIEGYFGLARFSTAVSSFYAVPKPTEDQIDGYVEALKNIIIREDAAFYIPVSEATTAYYDAFAKPQIENLGCECICPDLRDVLLLDDTHELMRKIQAENLPVPVYYPITNFGDLKRTYDYSTARNEPHTLISVGLSGCKNRQQIYIPSKKHIRTPQPLNEQNPWLLIQEFKGDKYITCTTVRDSQIIANVSCKVDKLGGLIPIEHTEIQQWLEQFFASLKFNRKIVGHMSFYFTDTEDGLIPMGCQVGVRKPYICYTSVQSRIVIKPCRHFSRHRSGPIVVSSGRYWLNEVLCNTLEYPSFDSLSKLIEIICGRNEALFTIWDPLPYCAYYYIQLPLNSLSNLYKKFTSR